MPLPRVDLDYQVAFNVCRLILRGAGRLMSDRIRFQVQVWLGSESLHNAHHAAARHARANCQPDQPGLESQYEKGKWRHLVRSIASSAGNWGQDIPLPIRV